MCLPRGHDFIKFYAEKRVSLYLKPEMLKTQTHFVNCNEEIVARGTKATKKKEERKKISVESREGVMGGSQQDTTVTVGFV